MSAFSSKSSGIGTYAIGGVIILILIAVGFSSLSTTIFQSSSVVKLNEERAGRIHDRGVHIDQSRLYLAKQKRYLVGQEALLEPGRMAARIQVELSAEHASLADLQLEITQREEEVEEIRIQKIGHRDKVRKHVWPRHLNQEIKAEHLAGPTDLRNPKIRKIDVAGLMVSHDSGASRIGVSELSQKFREALALDVAEARKAMADLLIRDALVKKSRSRRAALAAQMTPGELDAIVSERLEDGVMEVDRYFDLIQVAEKTAEIARYNDRYSSSRSLPGKLETWADRAKKFDRAAVNYRQKFEAAVRRVKNLDPSFQIPKK